MFIPRAQPHAQSLFLFPIVFGINLIHFFNEKKNVAAGNSIACFATSIPSHATWQCEFYEECELSQWFSVAPFAHKGRWRNFHVFGALSLGLNFNIFWIFFAHFFCYAVSSCVYDHSHPYLVSECLFLAENKTFPYPRRLRAHPRRLRAILWDAAATCSVAIFVVVAEKKRSRNLSVSWLYGLVNRLPVSAIKFRRAQQRHFLVDFQTKDIAGKIFSWSKRAFFALVNRARNGWTAFARSLPTRRFHDWSKTEAALQRQRHCSVICQSIFKAKISLERSFPALNEHVLLLWIEREMAEQRPLEVCRRNDFAIDRRLRAASVRGTAASFVDRFSNPRYHWKDLCLLWTTHVLLLWIERETAEQRPLEVCRRIDFANDWRPRPLWSSTFLQAIQSTRNMRCIRDIDLEKVWNKVQKLKTFFFSTW